VFSKYAAILAVAATALALSSCATTGKTKEPLSDSVSVVLLSENELIQKFGHDYDLNPFIAPNGTILPKNYDFIVAKLDISTVQGAHIELNRAEVIEKDKNRVKAVLYDRKTFAEYIANNSPSQMSMEKRVRVVNWWYIPSNSMNLKPGKYEYLLVFMGKHPVPDNLEAQVDLSVDSQEQEIDLPIPDQNQ
jgi:hypothetical protein